MIRLHRRYTIEGKGSPGTFATEGQRLLMQHCKAIVKVLNGEQWKTAKEIAAELREAGEDLSKPRVVLVLLHAIRLGIAEEGRSNLNRIHAPAVYRLRDRDRKGEGCGGE